MEEKRGNIKKTSGVKSMKHILLDTIFVVWKKFANINIDIDKICYVIMMISPLLFLGLLALILFIAGFMGMATL